MYYDKYLKYKVKYLKYKQKGSGITLFEILETGTNDDIAKYINESMNLNDNKFLFALAEANDNNRIQKLIDCGININIVNDGRGETILFTAVRTKNVDLVRMIIHTTNININHQNKKGETVLFIICNDINPIAILIKNILIDAGINTQIQNNLGQNCYYNNKIKQQESQSVIIRRQIRGECFAHTVARNFVRTLQLLGAIVSDNSNQISCANVRNKNITKNTLEKFYDVFLLIVTNKFGCDGGHVINSMFYLLEYIKNNYEQQIFDIDCVKFDMICGDKNCPIGFTPGASKILNISQVAKKQFIDTMKILFDNNILYIGQVNYLINYDQPNYIYDSIKKMLEKKLQPAVLISYSESFTTINKNKTNNIMHIFPSILNTDISNNKCITDKDKEKEKHSNHAVNLRRWFGNGIEFKNSWGYYHFSGGNFSVQDLSIIMCSNGTSNKTSNETSNEISNPFRYVNFITLGFNTELLPKSILDIYHKNNCQLYKTVDPNLPIGTNKNYKGKYDSNGLASGYGTLKTPDNIIYTGNFVNGILQGNGKIIFSQDEKYYGNFVNGFLQGNGIIKLYNKIIYEGIFVDNVMQENRTKKLPDGTVYKGTFIDVFCKEME